MADSAVKRESGLQGNALTTRDLLIAGMSYMAPGFSFFFTTALIASAAGAQMPVAYALAGLGVLAAGAVFSEFSRHAPSAGSLPVFVERGFGRRAGMVAGLVLITGYLCLQAGVLALFGGWTAELIESATGLSVPWPVLSVVGLVAATALMVRGVGLSIKATWVLFIVEFALVVVIVLVVIARGGAEGLSAAPFDVFSPDNGWSGIAVGMVFAVFSFVGFEGAVSFAEETANPRKALPVAVMGGILIMAVLYVVGTYAAVVGFGAGNVGELAADAEPVATLAARFVAPVAPLLAFAVFTSIGANLMAAGNANARILFDMGRQGVVNRRLGAIAAKSQTPAVAIVVFMVITGVFCLGGAVAGWDYLSTFGYIAGMGSFLAILVYMVSTAALPFYLRRKRLRLRPWKHIAVPLVGAGIWLVPLWGATKPGQSFPANLYPWVALVLIAAAVIFAVARTLRPIGTKD